MTASAGGATAAALPTTASPRSIRALPEMRATGATAPNRAPSAAAGAAAGGGDKSPWPEFGGGYGKRGGAGGDARAAGRERVRGGGAEEVFRSSGTGAAGRPARGSFGDAAAHAAAEMDKGWAAGSVPEVDELDVRDDLRCWNSRI